MFAILKFQRQTNAAAFSHAFVLTIKVCPSLDESLFNLKYPIIREVDTDTTFEDLNMLPNVEEKSKTVICTIDKISPTNTGICQSQEINQVTKHGENILNRISEISVNCDMQNDTIDKSVNSRESLDANDESTVTYITDNKHIDSFDNKSHNHTCKNDFINYNSRALETGTKHYINDVSLRAIRNVNKTKNEAHITTKSENENQKIHKYIFSPTKSTFSEVIKNDNVDEWPLSNRFSINEVSAEIGNVVPINNKDSLKDNIETTNKTVAESYQYFIEKEIENTKYNMNTDTIFPDNRRPSQETLKGQNTFEIKNTNKNFIAKMLEKDNDLTKNEHHNEIAIMKSEQKNTQHVSVCKVGNSQEQNNSYAKSYKSERRKQKSRESDKKIVSNDKMLRSSNITDLVMEGLMFTIRQDKDSMAVIEQKTKLEVDEVLENSEKVETKAGEKCLLNSSLLRLENLVTMIDLPRDKGQQHKSDPVISNNVYLPPLNIFNNKPVYNSSNERDNCVDRSIDKSNCFSYNKQNIDQLNSYRPQYNFSDKDCSAKYNTIEDRLIEWKDCKRNVIKNMHENHVKVKRKEEKSYTTSIEKGEDIIPETFQSTTSSSTEKESQHSLSIGNMDIEDSIKRDTCMKDFDRPSSSQSSSNLDNISGKDIILSEKSRFKQETNVPRIVSNKIITVEEMPLALQRVLRQTGKRRKLSSTIKNDNSETEVKKIKDATSVENLVFQTNVSSEKTHTESSVAINPLSVNTMVVSAETECNKDITSSKSMAEIEISTAEKNTKKSNNETHRNLRSTLLKHGLSRKLQDITEDFYNDLMYMHNKDNATQQRCLRQRRKCVNNTNNIKNSKMSIEMFKFIQDITEGARVVVKRLNIDNKSSLLEKNSSLATCMH